MFDQWIGKCRCMNRIAHKTEGVNRTKNVWFYPFVFTGNDPRKGRRIPLNEIKYNEQRDEETPIKEDDLFFNVSGATSGRPPCFVAASSLLAI